MTTTATTDTITVTDADGKELTVSLDQATDLITKLLAARKEGYEARRVARVTAQAATKLVAAEKKAERVKAATAKKAERVAKLEAKLAELKKTAKAA